MPKSSISKSALTQLAQTMAQNMVGTSTPTTSKSKTKSRKARKMMSTNQSRLAMAPAAVSSSYHGTQIRFGAASFNGKMGLKVSGCIPLVQLGGANVVSDALIYASGNQRAIMALNPVGLLTQTAAEDSTTLVVDNPVGNALSTFAQAFLRYRLMRGRLSYEAAYTTETTLRYLLAVSEDPCQPVFGIDVLSDESTRPVTESSLYNTENVQQFAAWNGFTLDMPCSKDLLFTFPGINIGDSGDVTSADTSDVRQAFSHSITAIGTNFPSSDVVITGTLYLEFEYEFYDLAPLSSSVVSLPLVRRRRVVRESTDDVKSYSVVGVPKKR